MKDRIRRCGPRRPARLCVWLSVLAVAVASETPAGEQSEPSIRPAARDSLVSASELHVHSGDFADAARILGQLVEAFPEDTDLLTRQGNALLKAGDFQSAINSFEIGEETRLRPSGHLRGARTRQITKLGKRFGGVFQLSPGCG